MASNGHFSLFRSKRNRRRKSFFRGTKPLVPRSMKFNRPSINSFEGQVLNVLKPELKSYDFQYILVSSVSGTALGLFNVNPAIGLLEGIGQGSEQVDRVGTRINSKSLHVKFQFIMASLTFPNQAIYTVRFLIIRDRSPNQDGTFNITKFFDNTGTITTQYYINPNVSSRYVILKDSGSIMLTGIEE